MIDLSNARDQLAGMRAGGDMSSLNATLEIKPQVVSILRVNSSATEAEVRWPDGTVETLAAAELAKLDLQ